MMQRIAFSKIVGIFLLASSTMVMLGWYLHFSNLVNLLPDKTHPIVFNSAFLFFLSGLALIYPRFRPFLGLFISLFATITLVQTYFHFDVGLDNVFVAPWLPDQQVHSGRMAENSALAFIFSGLAMFLFSYKKFRLIAILLQVTIFTTLLLGISSLLIYIGWYQNNRMPLHTTVAIILIGMALWSKWNKSKEFKHFYHNAFDKKIIILSLIVMLSITIFSAFTLFIQPLSIINAKNNLIQFILFSLVIGITLFFIQLLQLLKTIHHSQKNVLIESDILQSDKEQVSKAAYRDPLTGLINRKKLEEVINEILTSSQRKKTQFALLYLDLDHFKNINETASHEAGDELLKVVAKRLKNILRENDIIARFSGDKFGILVTEVTGSTITIIANKILNTILAPIVIKGNELYITLSIGISVYPDDGQDFQTLIKNASIALSRAKEQGRNNYQFSTHEMTTVAQEKIAKQSALNQAFVKNEFYLEYQPYLNLQTGRVAGIEAFIRWDHEKYGEITIDEIYNIAGDTPLIKLLNQWMLSTGCQQIKEWQDQGFAPLIFTFQLSLKHLKHVSLKEDILLTLQENNFAPRDLEISINENNFNQESLIIIKNIQSLKKLGIQLSIDHFGKISSSLEYLKKYGIDKIKIDKSFINQLPQNKSYCDIIAAIIAIANKLAIKSFASGVETRAQFEWLVKEKCTELQGSYFCSSQSAEATQTFLKEFMDKSISEETAGVTPDA